MNEEVKYSFAFCLRCNQMFWLDPDSDCTAMLVADDGSVDDQLDPMVKLALQHKYGDPELRTGYCTTCSDDVQNEIHSLFAV